MGRAIDLFVTYRFLKLLTTPFKKTDAFKLGIIDAKGHRILKPKTDKPAVEIATTETRNAYTILHKLVFNIKKLFAIWMFSIFNFSFYTIITRRFIF